MNVDDLEDNTWVQITELRRIIRKKEMLTQKDNKTK